MIKLRYQDWSWEQKPPEDSLRIIEKAARTCYKSQDKAKQGSEHALIKQVLRKGHGSVIEHVTASVRIITDRGVSHELVRHRLASFSQERRLSLQTGTKHFLFTVVETEGKKKSICTA